MLLNLQMECYEALLRVIRVRDIKVKNYRDTGYFGGKLTGYGIFKNPNWHYEDTMHRN